MVFKKVVFIGLMASLLALMLGILVEDINFNYGGDVNTSPINVTDDFEQIVNKSDTIREQLTQNSDVSTLESIASFFNAGFTSATLVFDVVPLVSGLLSTAWNTLPIHPAVQTAILAGLTFIVVVALIALITGRVIDK